MKIGANTMARLLFVGVLSISAIALAIWEWRSTSAYAAYQILTDDAVSGLAIDAPIEFHGVDVGKVRAVELTSPRSVRVVLSIAKSAPVSSATVATITSRGLATRGYTGYVYISLDDGDYESQPLTAQPGDIYPVIRTAKSKIITLDTSISQVKDDVDAITTLLRSLLDRQTLSSLQQSVGHLNVISQAIAANTGKLKTIVVNTERASGKLDPLLHSTGDLVRQLHTNIVPAMEQDLADLKPLLESSHDSISTVQTEILPKALNALGTLDDLSSTITDLAEKLDRDPSIIIRGSTPPLLGPGESK